MNTQHNTSQKRGQAVPLALGLAIAKSYGGSLIIARLLKGPLEDSVTRVDRRVTRIVRRAESDKLDPLMALMSGLGEPFAVYPVAGMAGLWWLIKGEKESSAGVAASLLGAALMNKAIKKTVQRPRPHFPLQRQGSSGSSYPSNHITMAFAAYGTIAYLITRRLRKKKRSRKARMLVWTPVLLLCSLIAWSRIYQGVHHGTDVLVGWLVAGIWVGASGQIADRLGSRS